MQKGVNMANKSDLTIFGASGFTGQYVVEEAVRSLPPDISITIAGRSTAKLQALAARLGQPGARLQVLGGVDVADVAALTAMVQQTRLVLNCAGPFRQLGEGVFAAAAAAGTDYLDICGEPEFIERMAHRYGADAAASGALMASAAGFDSVPADLGCLFTCQSFPQLFGTSALPAAVEAVISFTAPLGTKIHFATWEAAVWGLSAVDSLRRLRREAAAAGSSHPPPKLIGRRPTAAEGPTWDKRLAAYTLPFPGADASIVRRTQAALSAAGEPAVHFTARFAVPTARTAALFVAYGGLMMALCKLSWGRALLLKYPGLFSKGLVSHAGPSQQQMTATTTTLDFFATGYSSPPPAAAAAAAGAAVPPPDLQLHSQVSLGDPGYLFTSVMLVQAAATMLSERQLLLQTAGGRGGVFTVGTLFRRSSIISRLNQHGVKFSVKSHKQVHSTNNTEGQAVAGAAAGVTTTSSISSGGGGAGRGQHAV